VNITLTYPEGRAVLTRVPGAAALRMKTERRNTWNKSHVYTLPAVGWKGILDRLRAEAYGPRGGYKQQSQSLYTAIAKITQAVLERELHPAFKPGCGVVGASADVIPAFLDGPRRKPYPPGQFVLLLPRHVVNRGRVLTVWEPDDWSPGEEPLYSEHLHQVVAVEVGFTGS